jgi:hypothetical protein
MIGGGAGARDSWREGTDSQTRLHHHCVIRIDPSPARDRNGVSPLGPGRIGWGFVKLDEEIADRTVMVKRRPPKFLHVRDPVWREDIAFRVGIPVLGAVVAAGLAWLITQL